MNTQPIRAMTLIASVLVAAVVGVAPTASAVSRCGTFELVPAPGMISHVTALDDGTVLALGGSASDPRELVLHSFDGNAWREQALPAEVEGFNFGASGSTPDGDSWFAGTRAYSVYEIEVVFMRVRGNVIDRVDTFLYASTINQPGAPVDISGSSVNEVWALTASGDVIHFDGSDWQAMDVPAVFSGGDPIVYPGGIYVAGPADVWIAAEGRPSRATYMSYTQHWDGNGWTTVPTPFDGRDLTFFRDIDGSGPNDIWVAGHWNYSEDILLHWDGSAWTQTQGPASGAPIDMIMAMAPGNAWALPYSLSAGDAFYYWNGAGWSEGARFDIPDAVTINWHDAAKAGDCDAWAVGAYYDGVGYQPLMARLVPGDVQSEVFVSAAEVSRVRASGKNYFGQAVVTIRDTDQAPVEGAAVQGDFSGPTGESQMSVTGPDGRAVFNSGEVSRPSGSWCFAVSDVIAEGAIYNETLNIAAEACEGGGDNGGGGSGPGKGKKR